MLISNEKLRLGNFFLLPFMFAPKMNSYFARRHTQIHTYMNRARLKEKVPGLRVKLGELDLVRSDRASIVIVNYESGAGGSLID